MTQNKNRAVSFAERLVRHFQKHGFSDVKEAIVLHIKGVPGIDYQTVSAEFAATKMENIGVPLSRNFEIRFIECFSESRDELKIRQEFQSDFEPNLRRQFPELFFEKKNYLFDENAVGTKYDIAIRIGRKSPDNVVKIVLLNDPGASFGEFFERQMKTIEEWNEICVDIKATVGKLALLQI